MVKKLSGKQFLAVDKSNFNQGLKSIDLMILSQIEEFQRNNCKCYMTNEQLSEAFGESQSTIKLSISKLEEMNVICKETSFVKVNGKGTRQRVLYVNDKEKWKITAKNGAKMEGSISAMEGSDFENGKTKNDEWKGQSEPIKNNIKNNEKDNIKDKNLSVPSNEGDFVGLLQKIGITYSRNTEAELEKIIGEELKYDILRKLIDDNQQTWKRNKNKSDNYRYGILKNLVKKDYRKTKQKILAIERYNKEVIESVKKMPKIRFNHLPEPKPEEGLSTEELLEMLDDEDEVMERKSLSDEPCESLKLLEQFARMKHNEEMDIFDVV